MKVLAESTVMYSNRRCSMSRSIHVSTLQLNELSYSVLHTPSRVKGMIGKYGKYLKSLFLAGSNFSEFSELKHFR